MDPPLKAALPKPERLNETVYKNAYGTNYDCHVTPR
jgi:hypothetical protein